MPAHPSPKAVPPPWHTLTATATARTLGLDDPAVGLAPAAAAGRLREVGPNRLPSPSRPGALAIVWHQFHSPLIYVLLAAAAVATALQDHADALFILFVVSCNAALGAFQEWRAERGAADLQSLLRVQARVVRGGHERTLDAEELVPGDVVRLEAGNRVPADLRLVSVAELAIDEAMLTGESAPARKQPEPLPAATPVAERGNLAYAGTLVVAGHGTGLVVATGLATEVGGIAAAVATTAIGKAPLVLRMERFARHVSFAVLAACALVAAMALARGMPTAEVFYLAVALAVSAIPEGLPVAVTVALSLSTSRMARRGVIVRQLPAVEGLGSCTLIASDKTGTLTVNRQTVRRVWLPDGVHVHVTGDGYQGEGDVTTDTGGPLPEAVAVRLAAVAAAVVRCNEATLGLAPTGWTHSGDAVDVALLAFAHKAGVDPATVRTGAPLLGVLPFASERAFAAAFHAEDDGLHVSVKGALERLLPRCTSMRTARGSETIDRARIELAAHELAGAGHRFLLVATGTLPAGHRGPWRDADLPPLQVLALVGLIDPPRPKAHAAIAACRGAGITVAMVTGDHPRTAFAIARDLGIADDERQIVTGSDLAAAERQGPGAVDALAARGRVFARVLPLQKLELVHAMHRLGHFVAVTGDGVNDAPALRAADIGVAMGSGADVAKDVAALLVTDDDFASIEAGVEEGRFAYDNIRKVTYLAISTGIAELALLLLALPFGLPVPLLAVQLLWLNLVTNGIQDVALAFEGGEPHAMQRPPRPVHEGLFDGRMVTQSLLTGGTMGLLAFGYWAWLTHAGTPEDEARNLLLLLFVLMENVQVATCRSEHESAFAVPWTRNKVLAVGLPGALLVHVVAMHVPWLQELLGTAPLAFGQWLWPLGLALVVLLVAELHKLVRRRRDGGSPTAQRV
jgi:magnesium-transporting ATPase (P-type)